MSSSDLPDSGSKTTTNAVALLEQLNLVDVDPMGQSERIILVNEILDIRLDVTPLHRLESNR